MNADAGNDPYSVIFHEYTHYMLSGAYSYLPLWIEEGCAEFYSTFYAQKDRVDIGLPVESHVPLLQKNTLLHYPQHG